MLALETYSGACPQKKDVCGYCTGEHPTRQCKKVGDTAARKCANCGQKNHAAWEKSACPAYAKHGQAQRNARQFLLEQMAQWKGSGWVSRPTEASYTAIKKRARGSSPSPDRDGFTVVQKRPGRPTKLSLKEGGQQPLAFNKLARGREFSPAVTQTVREITLPTDPATDEWAGQMAMDGIQSTPTHGG